MPAELILRADAGEELGAGHVMRCLALAQAWPGPVRLLTAAGPVELVERYTAQGFEIREARVGWEKELDSDCWVVLDGYRFDEDLQQTVLASGASLLVMDDTVELPIYRAHIILNQNVGAESFTYPVEGSPLLLLGGRFILLRDEFLRWRGDDELAGEVRRILITLGGSAAPGAYEAILEALALAGAADLQVRLISPQGGRREGLRELARRRRVAVEFLDPTPDLPRQVKWADLVLSGAGSTLWELAYLGRPALPLVLADNQKHPAWTMEARGALRCLGHAPDWDPTGMAEILRETLQDRAERCRRAEKARQVVDGRGRERVVSLMHLMRRKDLNSEDYQLRRAGPDDLYDLFRLANDPGVRSQSLNPSAIPLEDHRAWFARILDAPDQVFFVFDFSGVVGAQIRYQRLDAQTAEVHFSVNAAFRGRGLGTRALVETFACATGELGVRRVLAHVKVGNQASSRAFASACYQCLQEVEVQGRTCQLFERSLS